MTMSSAEGRCDGRPALEPPVQHKTFLHVMGSNYSTSGSWQE